MHRPNLLGGSKDRSICYFYTIAYAPIVHMRTLLHIYEHMLIRIHQFRNCSLNALLKVINSTPDLFIAHGCGTRAHQLWQ